MSDQVEVRLLFPNLGKEAGETVLMDTDTAKTWVHRRLAELVVGDTLSVAVAFGIAAPMGVEQL
jgi:hypothetical protein